MRFFSKEKRHAIFHGHLQWTWCAVCTACSYFCVSAIDADENDLVQLVKSWSSQNPSNRRQKSTAVNIKVRHGWKVSSAAVLTFLEGWTGIWSLQRPNGLWKGSWRYWNAYAISGSRVSVTKRKGLFALFATCEIIIPTGRKLIALNMRGKLWSFYRLFRSVISNSFVFNIAEPARKQSIRGYVDVANLA